MPTNFGGSGNAGLYCVTEKNSDASSGNTLNAISSSSTGNMHRLRTARSESVFGGVGMAPLESLRLQRLFMLRLDRLDRLLRRHVPLDRAGNLVLGDAEHLVVLRNV